MCSSKPPKVQPVAMAPTASPEAIDNVAVTSRETERRRLRNQYGRQQTILAGNVQGGGMPTMPAKTALGT